MSSEPKSAVRVVVAAAGSGSRMRAGLPKQYIEIAGRRIAEHTLDAIRAVERIGEIVVAIAADDKHWGLLPASLRERVQVVPGGVDRAASVARALDGFSRQPEADDWVLVHDMARPCIRPQQIRAFIDELEHDEVGGLLAIPVVDTLKRTDTRNRVLATVERTALWRAQTPQMFRYGLLARALQVAREQDFECSDEAMAVELLGLQPRIVLGSADNIKVTLAEDIGLAEFHLSRRQGASA